MMKINQGHYLGHIFLSDCLLSCCLLLLHSCSVPNLAPTVPKQITMACNRGRVQTGTPIYQHQVVLGQKVNQDTSLC